MNFRNIIFSVVCLVLVFSFMTKEVSAATTTVTEQKITVLSPSGTGGTESFKRGEKIPYSWTQTKNSKKLEVSLYGGPENKTVYKEKKYDGWGTNKKFISAKETVKLAPGQYGLLICDYAESKTDPVCDGSDGTITITDEKAAPIAESLKSSQKIEILSPNGGETYNRGEKITYTYKLENNSKKLEVKILDDSTSLPVYSEERYDGWGTNKKIITEKDSVKIIPGNYRLQICDNTDIEKGGKAICDMSSAYFSIIGKNVTDNSSKIQIVSPKNNISVKRNTLVELSYKTLDSTISKVDMWLVSKGEDKKVYSVAKNYPTASGVFSFASDIPTGTPLKNGSYSFAICPAGISVKSTDCATFHMELTGADSTINLITPKGGEMYKVGGDIKVDFTTNTPGTYEVSFSTSTKGSGTLYSLGKKVVDKVGNIQTIWKIPSTVPEDKYTVFVELLDTKNVCVNTCASAESESFSVTKGTVAIKTPVFDYFNSSKGNVIAGEPAVLSWGVSNVNRCIIQYLDKEESVSPKGTKTVYPNVTTSYKIWCTNDPGTGKDGPAVDKTLEVKVSNSNQIPKIKAVNPNTTDSDLSDGTYGDTQKQENKTRVEETRIINGAPTDACKNLPGDQSGIPSGYTNVGVKLSGNCKKVGAIDEFSEPIKQEENKNQEQRKEEPRTEKVCQILKTTIISQKFQQKKEEWKTVKCDGEVFKNTPKKDRRTKDEKVETGKQSASESVYPMDSNLELGMTNQGVITLQKYLNSNGYIVNTVEGEPGSLGYESDYFGQKTKQALIKFQQDKGISPAQGYFGAKTRGVMGI
jgi:hypothetical protein